MYDDYNEDPRFAKFANPGGNSALRAGPRIYPCPTCGEPDRLSLADKRLGYQCDECADAAERGY
jgi:hypothetical protein